MIAPSPTPMAEVEFDVKHYTTQAAIEQHWATAALSEAKQSGGVSPATLQVVRHHLDLAASNVHAAIEAVDDALAARSEVLP